MDRALVVVGASLGGLAALKVLLGGLSESFPWPVAVVQHRSAEDSDSALTEALQRATRLSVREVEDKEPIESGRVYLCPADYHLLVERECFALSTEARVCGARPSIDVLFDSAAAICGRGLVAVVLTGASTDGSAGAARVKAVGGVVIVQDPATAESPTMPRAVLRAVEADRVLALDAIAPALNLLAACEVAAE